MAKKKAETAGAEAETTALVRWDKQLAEEAEAAAAQEAGVGGGMFFSIRGGVLSVNDAPIPGNEVAVVILDSVLENAFYPGEFDADNTEPPTCYAFGRDEKTIAPFEESPEPKCASCAECEANKFNSAEKGRGKACKNRRRLACLSAGTIENGKFKLHTDAELLAKGDIVFLNLPPTSIRPWAAYVKQLAGAMRRPPHGVVTKIKVVPDPKSTFKVVCEALSPVPDKLLPVVIKRRDEAKSTIISPYPKPNDNPPAKGKGKGTKAASGKAKSKKF